MPSIGSFFLKRKIEALANETSVPKDSEVFEIRQKKCNGSISCYPQTRHQNCARDHDFIVTSLTPCVYGARSPSMRLANVHNIPVFGAVGLRSVNLRIATVRTFAISAANFFSACSYLAWLVFNFANNFLNCAFDFILYRRFAFVMGGRSTLFDHTSC